MAVWLECDVVACDREVPVSRAVEFGWVVDAVDTLCPTHGYLSARVTDSTPFDVRAAAAGDDADAW